MHYLEVSLIKISSQGSQVPTGPFLLSGGPVDRKDNGLNHLKVQVGQDWTFTTFSHIKGNLLTQGRQKVFESNNTSNLLQYLRPHLSETPYETGGANTKKW